MRTIEDVLTRLRAEFLEMPDLRLKSEQVQRLCGVERTMCQMVLDVLVEEEFLCVKLDGHYARLTDGHHPHPAKADLKTEPRFVKAS
jgi:endonuclease III